MRQTHDVVYDNPVKPYDIVSLFAGMPELKEMNPFNSINFLNLVPACPHCNSSYKLADDLIEQLIATPKENVHRFKKKLSGLKGSRRFIDWS